MGKTHVIATTGDLQDGQMKQVEAGGQKILLVRVGGAYHAYYGECPHHGAPLAEGVLCEGRICCPWHQSIFDAATGEFLEPPTLDNLAELELTIAGEQISVSLPEKVPTFSRPALARADAKADGRTFIIVGGGAAGLIAAQTLRREGFRGRVVMVTREADRPYDRTELSKRYLAKVDAPMPFLRPAEFFADAGIELMTGRDVTSVDAASRTVTAADGWSLSGDGLLLCTGGVPRRLGVAGEELANVFLLRSLGDCERLRAAAKAAKKVVVIGAGFIGMEVAASLASRKLDVTVVAPDAVPFGRTFGDEIGLMYQRLGEEKGVRFRLGAKVERFEGDKSLRAVVLEGGERLDADFAVVGVGVTPATGIVRGAAINDDASISVDECLQTAGAAGGVAPNVYAAGDVARFPDWRTGEMIRIEHWRLAQQHGQTAAMNLAGKRTEFRGVPFFWTSQHSLITQYVGFAGRWDEIVFDGRPAERKFIACYVRDGKVHAAAGCDADQKLAAIGELIRRRGLPSVDEVRAAGA